MLATIDDATFKELSLLMSSLIGLGTLCIGVGTLFIAYRQHATAKGQHDTAEAKLKLDLYDKRFAVIENVLKWSIPDRVDDWERNVFTIHQCRFLFSEDIQDVISSLLKCGTVIVNKRKAIDEFASKKDDDEDKTDAEIKEEETRLNNEYNHEKEAYRDDIMQLVTLVIPYLDFRTAL